MWTRLHRGGAEAFDSNAHAQTALIISQCLHWKRNPRVLWCFFFAQVISCLRAALLRILWYITDMAAVCLCALHYFLPEKCIEISEMHPYRHLHRLWNTCGRQCSYFLSRHGCLTSPALPLPVSLLFCLAPWTLRMVLLSLLLVASEFPACSALWNWMRCLAARSGWETRLRKEKLCFCLVKKLFFFFFFLAWRKSLTPHCHRPRALGGHILSVWQRRRDSHIHSVRCLPSCIYNTSNVGVSNICPH